MERQIQENTLTPITPSRQPVVTSHSPVTLCLVQMAEPKFAGQIPQPHQMAPHAVVSWMYFYYYTVSYLYDIYTANF
jgi:hypothetical protein